MPEDTTPHGGEALHPLPDRATIPQPRPSPGGDPLAAQAGRRDPVVDDGPGIAGDTGKPSPVHQPG